MKIILTGATGFAGSEVLAQALGDDGIAEVLVLTRRPTGVTHAKLREQLQADFRDYSGIALDGYDACIWCLGVSQVGISEADYVTITRDYALAAAQAMWRANPALRFCFVSGRSADPTEQKRALYARIKGRTERDLAELGGAHVFCFRPGYIRATARSVRRKDAGRFFAPLGALLGLFSDELSVDCDELARALLRVARHGAAEPLLINSAIRRLGHLNSAGDRP